MDKIVSLLQWHSFNSSTEKNSEKRACCAVKIPAFSHLQTFITRAIQHLFIQQSFSSSAVGKNAEKRVYYAVKYSQYLRILAFSAYIHGQGHSTFIIHSILQEKHLEIRIQEWVYVSGISGISAIRVWLIWKGG